MDRKNLLNHVVDYESYLIMLNMKIQIASFDEMNKSRISQLSNKSNQYNLTTKRYTEKDIDMLIDNKSFLTFQIRLSDKFGDNGMISTIVARLFDNQISIDSWLMSCRVLKRGVEQAAMNRIVDVCKDKGIEKINGTFIPTDKNMIVKSFYKDMGFKKINQDDKGNTVWVLEIKNYKPFQVYMEETFI